MPCFKFFNSGLALTVQVWDSHVRCLVWELAGTANLAATIAAGTLPSITAINRPRIARHPA